MSRNTFSRNIHRRAWLQLLAAGFLVYAVAAGMGGLRLSLEALSTADAYYILLAAASISLSYVFAAVTYVLLVPRHIRFVPTLLVQISGGLVNRMLPAGLGGMGLNVLYLKKTGLSVSIAAAVAATNNSLGFIGNALLLTITILIFPPDTSKLRLPDVPVPVVAAIIAIAIIVLLVTRHHSLAAKLRRSLLEMIRYLRDSLRRPGRILGALLSSIMLTALHGLGLFFVLYAIGEPQAWPVSLLAVSVGTFVGAATPTPGGLGGAEAGIAAVLLAFSVPAGVGIAAALLYRGLTYWLPLMPGYIALRIVEKRYL